MRREVRGREHWLAFDGGPLREPQEWIEYYREFWQRRLDGLAEFLAEENKKLNDRKDP